MKVQISHVSVYPVGTNAPKTPRSSPKTVFKPTSHRSRSWPQIRHFPTVQVILGSALQKRRQILRYAFCKILQ